MVDDDEMNREVLQIQLEGVDMLVDTAESGDIAIAKAKEMSYSAIFMDMQMPQMDGMEATSRIRELSEYGDVPIIAITANVFSEDKEKCFNAGMNDFLSKPFNPDALFETLFIWLEKNSNKES